MALHALDHPLIAHKLSILRDERTGPKEFRELVEEVAMLMAYEATRDLPLREVQVRTPLEPTVARALAGKPVIVPILRAGLGMVGGVLRLLPTADVGHIGVYRDHDTHAPVEYYCNVPPDLQGREVFVCDPMLATGGSARVALRFLKRRGADRLRLLCLIAAPEGVAHVEEEHPEVPIYCAALDRQLDENAYIRPGLGDAGDRLFGTA